LYQPTIANDDEIALLSADSTMMPLLLLADWNWSSFLPVVQSQALEKHYIAAAAAATPQI